VLKELEKLRADFNTGITKAGADLQASEKVYHSKFDGMNAIADKIISLLSCR
jgi:hypothetical protein